LALSAFNKIRFNNSDLAQLKPENFTVTEELLNEALVNITISSFALNKRSDLVNGTSTRVLMSITSKTDSASTSRTAFAYYLLCRYLCLDY
jgi:hypothetical protein